MFHIYILLQKFQVFKPWTGFKWSGCEGMAKEIKPWFQVRKDCKILATSTCNVSLGCDHKAKGNCYRIVGLREKSEFKIIRGETQVVAEVRSLPIHCLRKKSFDTHFLLFHVLIICTAEFLKKTLKNVVFIVICRQNYALNPLFHTHTHIYMLYILYKWWLVRVLNIEWWLRRWEENSHQEFY